MLKSFGIYRCPWKRDSPLDQRLQGSAWTSSKDEKARVLRYLGFDTNIRDYYASGKCEIDDLAPNLSSDSSSNVTLNKLFWQDIQ